MDFKVIFATLTTSATLAVFAPAVAEKITPQVIHIESLSQIPSDHPPKTLFLFDLDDTIFDSFSMLGSRAWRRYIVEATKKIDPSRNWHDIFSYALAQKHPMTAVEELTSAYVKDKQANDFIAVGFTSRERQAWYDTPHEGVDALTVQQLSKIGVDFNNGSLENNYPDLANHSEYFKGVFFANIEPKGAFLTDLLEKTSTHPVKVVFIDDKLSQVDSVANALSDLGIPHECYFYLASDKKGKQFDPLLANIQLYHFYASKGEAALSDQDAEAIAASDSTKDADFYLKATIDLAKTY